MDLQKKSNSSTAEQLAIASVPMQKSEKIYPPSHALKVGTIYPELNLPFFATDSLSATTGTCGCSTKDCKEYQEKYASLFTDQHFDRETVMNALYEISFFLNDLTLYLDTHPEDDTAIGLYNQFNADRKKLLQRMEVDFYPLTANCIVDARGNENHFSWTDGAMPWEGACI